MLLKPDNADALYERGKVYRKMALYDRAIEDFNAALELDPDNIYIYNNRGLALYEKKVYDRAIEDSISAEPVLVRQRGPPLSSFRKPTT